MKIYIQNGVFPANEIKRQIIKDREYTLELKETKRSKLKRKKSKL
jgi:hypothetical protein